LFNVAQLIGSAERELPLSTRKNRHIANAQAPSTLDERIQEKYRGLLANHRQWEERKPACGVYNCFGHVWAARRTSIYEQSEIEKILDDDGYRSLTDREQPRRGDLILYFVDDVLYHVGVVYEFRQAIHVAVDSPSVELVPWVLSKWDDTKGEVLHSAYDVPWAIPRLQFKTDRP
jgi:hypothetical protein